MQTRSNTWSKVSNVGISADIKSGNSSITLLQPDGAGYYNMKASDLNGVGTAYEIAMKGFQKGHNGSIIVNVDCSGVDTVNMPKAFIYIDGQQQSTNEVTEFSAGKVIWNFINANGVTINTNLMSGMVVALGATVNALQNLNGTIVAENIHNTGETHRTDFTGTTVPAQAAFGGVKTVDGETPNANQKFTFKLDELIKDASGNNVWGTIQTVQNSGKTIGFSDISYTTEGIHWYRIYEDQTAVGGYKLTTSQYIMKVVVTRSQTSSGNTKFDKNITYYKVNGSDTNAIDPGTLIDGDTVNESLLETKTSSSDFTFDNKEQKAEAEFKVVKTYEHDADAKFNFKLTATGANAENTPMPATTEIQVSQNSGGTFGKISYTAAGEYTYEVSEIPGNENEIRYDSKVYEVKVTVDNNFNVKVEYKVKDDVSSTWTESVNEFTASFTNTYTEQKGSLKITKVAGTNTDLSGKTFYFKVTGPNNYSTVERLNYSENTSITISGLMPGIYTVTETDKMGNPVTTGKSFLYTVAVPDNGQVNVTAGSTAEITVTNTKYQAAGSLALTAEKTLTGKELKAGAYSFILSNKENKVLQTKTNDADGKVAFDPISYTIEDAGNTYTYNVSEIEGTESGVTYDKTIYTVTAAITDNGDGTLKVEKEIKANDKVVENITFNNKYKATGKFELTATKKLSGKELKENAYSFKLSDAEGKELQTKKNAADGTVTFDPISYTLKDAGKDFAYTVEEVKGSEAGVSYDGSKYTVTVHVTDNGNGTLTAETAKVTKATAENKTEEANAIVFDNEYHASGQAQLNGTKTLLGSRGGDIKEGEFTFQVLDEDGNEVTTGKTLAADETGKAQIAFEPISYTEKNAGKTYTYTVQETAGEDKNITYDTTIYVVTVKVSDNLDGTLETEVTYPEGFENGLTFTNSYKASGAATLKTTKTLEGRTAALAANEFVFSLYEVAADGTRTPVLDKDGNPMCAFNDAEGNVIFGEISYTQDDQGTHNYEIVEEAGNDSAVTYDKEPVKATVTVSDKDGSGVLNAEAVYEKDGHTSFRNEYHANGKITFTGLKKLTGKRAAKIKDGEFTFIVKDDATGETVATGKTKDGGVIEFTEISYTEKDKGEHTYTITEDKGSDSSITYSEESVKVTVNVTDSNNGSLEATATYPEGGATFTNAYNAAGEVVLKASKTLEGSTLAADQFSFELKDEQGNVLQTKKNDADGKVTFDSLKYTEKDIDKTYTYTVSEVNNDITGVTYDNDVYTVKVQITDSKDSNGTLNITETSEKDKDVVEEITFVNTFAGTVKLIKTSTEGRALPGAEFALYSKNDKGEYDLYTADNEKGLYTTDAKGQINVENLPADDYYFIETAAPDGYKIRKADDGSDQKYSFKIGIEDGDAGIVENAKVNAELTVQNDINGTNSITVTKKITYIDPDTFDEFEMTWPKDQIFYVNLFTDPEGTIPYRTSTPKAFTVSKNSSGTATFENVSKGTYYVFETDAEGNSIPMDEEMLDSNGKRYSATVDGDGTNQVELDVKTDAEEGKINLINRYFDMPGGAAYKGWINISKNILKGTDQIDVDDTFYAGIFTKTEDGEYDLYSVVTLANNNTVKTEVTLGGENGDQPITYYVYETDEQGNRIDQNEFAYTVTGEGEVSLDKSNTTADITITNTLNEQYSLLIRKVDENKDALVGAQFQITDGNGNVTDTWTSTLEDHPVVLEPGTYKLSELVAPDGYKPGSEVTITVDDEGGISIESEVDGEADFDEDEDGILDYINYPETTITPTATPSAKTTPTGNQTTSRTSVKTGDDTPIALYILLLAVAACAAGGAVTVSRKKRKNK